MKPCGSQVARQSATAVGLKAGKVQGGSPTSNSELMGEAMVQDGHTAERA